MHGDREHGNREPGDQQAEQPQPALVELLAPALDRCSALADRLAHLILDPP